MRIHNRRRKTSTLPYRVSLWLLVGLVAALVYFDNSPPVLETEKPEPESVETTREALSDVVVVLDYQAIRNSEDTFSTRDWSAAWINLFEQELGPVGVATPESLSTEQIDAARVVVLTASVSHQIPESLREQLRQFALDGNTLVVERPKGKVRDAFSSNGRAGIKQGQEITYARDLDEPYRSQLLKMPLSTQFVGSTEPRSGATTLLGIDGAPVIYSVPMGSGNVITVDFDLGEQLVALQQGRPTENFRVHDDNEETERPPKTSALIMNGQLDGSAVPYADLLERFVVHGVIGRYAALPTLWPYPDGANGVVVGLHEDQTLGDGGGWMLEHETSRGGTSTLLTSIDSGLTAAGAAVISRRGGEIGLLWKPTDTPVEMTESIGLWGVEPLAQPLTLEDQIETLRKTLPGTGVHTVKTAERWWAPQWTLPFRTMAEQDISLDTSYEPERTGYAFGTGFPFRTFDSDGTPTGVRELPVVVPSSVDPPRDDSPENSEAEADDESLSLGELLDLSQQGHHQVIGFAQDPAEYTDFPDMNRFEDWVRVFDRVDRTGHVYSSARRLTRFLRDRRASVLKSDLIRNASMPDDKPKPEVSARRALSDDEDDAPEKSSEEKALLLRLTVDAKRKNMTMTVPKTIDGHTLTQVRKRASRVAGELVSERLSADDVNLVGYKLQRVSLDPGFNHLDVYYRKQ